MGLEQGEPDKPKRPNTRVHVVFILILMAALLAVAIALAVMVVQREQALADLHAANSAAPQAATTASTPASTTTTDPRPTQGHYRFAAVASDTLDVCSPVGTEIMGRRGGSAVDAAIATILCVGIANPMSNGIGGGHFMTVYIRAEKKAYTIVAREMAPAGATSGMFMANGSLSTEGGLAVGVPGELMGLWEAHKRWGKLPWGDLLQPAIDLCEEGVPVSPPLYAAISSTARSSRNFLDRFPELRRLLTNPATGQVYKLGEKMKRPLLAETLRTLQRENATSFYSGSLAEKIVAEVTAAGGIITREDLANYTAAVKDPLVSTIHSEGQPLSVFSPPAPSSGVVYQYILNILNGYNFTRADLSTPERKLLTYHRIVEAFKFAYAKRTALGDGDGEDQAFRDNLRELEFNMTSPMYVEAIRQQIWDNQTHPPLYYGPILASATDHGTAHLSVLAPNGDAVSITSTVNLYFGSKVVGNMTGIIYNNEMDDFSTPNLTNAFGVPASPANFIKPGKRPLSSTCPSILVDHNHDVRLVVGASGGTRITTSAALVTMWNTWFGFSAKEAVTAKRFHHQLYPSSLAVETGFPQELIEGLKMLGHKVDPPEGAASNVQAVAQNGNDVTAYSDPRKDGRTDGF